MREHNLWDDSLNNDEKEAVDLLIQRKLCISMGEARRIVAQAKYIDTVKQTKNKMSEVKPKKPTFVIYSTGEHAVITTEEQEAAMLKEWCAALTHRNIDDYDRRTSTDMAVFVSPIYDGEDKTTHRICVT